MNQTNFNRIKKLLDDSGLLSQAKQKAIADFDFSNETILITGAAGTIGSGIAKQLIKCSFKQLVLLDNAETPLYFLQKELELLQLNKLHFIVSDIRDEHAMKELFKIWKPSLVFHTAAYKHVPLMESNPYEAIKLNVLGTKILADLALKHHTKKFVFISTDKAANPISVMGMTKWIAENHLNGLNTLNKTTFLITRFGNVLGSNGSLIPLFKKQIQEQNAITITHKAVTRYVINKNRACHLILKIASLDHWKSHVFTFDMGKPIKIIDLANVFIQLQNRKPASDIKLNFIGLRPGEKLHEDMISDSEKLCPTEYSDIWYIIPKQKKEQPVFNLKPLQNIKAFQTVSDIKHIISKFCQENL